MEETYWTPAVGDATGEYEQSYWAKPGGSYDRVPNDGQQQMDPGST